ncbi:MAG TPA: YihY/virulence factor BrkB family protein, partial [Candidatus Binatia bacterium]|nr:YihY/virulence factor BrkB family protein [Candidatus Binatia bacterium]
MAGKRIPRLIKILSGAVSDAEDDIFQLEGRFERLVHFWVLVCKSFTRNRCPIRAAALSYSSLLALIPLLAVAISVTSSLLKQEGEEKIYQAIDKFVNNIMPPATISTNSDETVSLNLHPGISVALTPTNRAALSTGTNSTSGTNLSAVATADQNSSDRVVSVNAQKTAAKSIHDFVQKTQSAKLGAIGMLLLVFVAIRMLANIEATFNDIWGVTRGRSWIWRIVLYWTTITLGPLALVGVLGLSGSAHLKTVESLFQRMPFIGSLIFDFLPLVLLWLIFALVYLLVPNTKVKFSAALIGGIVAGSAWHVNNMLGFLYASRVVTNSKIYGSLGLVPVFMIGLYFSWIILLFGAQVAYAFQNRKSYLQQKLVENVNHRGREFVALRIMTSLGQRFHNALRPATVFQLSNELSIPGPLVQSVLRTLAYKQLVTEVAGA